MLALKTKAEYAREYQEGGLKPVAFYTICNWGGLGIIECDDERVVIGEFFGDMPVVIHKLKLHYNQNGDSYFVLNNTRYHLYNFCRI